MHEGGTQKPLKIIDETNSKKVGKIYGIAMVQMCLPKIYGPSVSLAENHNSLTRSITQKPTVRMG